MSRSKLERIKEYVRLGKYDMTAHAMEEMAEDSLDIGDVEQAILTGKVTKNEKHDPRGTKYVIAGVAADGIIPVGVVGRFTETDRFLIVTVYEITELE